MMVLVTESWLLSIFGWVWFTVQEPWVPSPLSAFVFYGFLALSTSHLIIVSLFVDARAPRVAYFNVVLVLTIFCVGCIADTFQVPVFGTVPAPSSPDNTTRVCCINCNIARYHRALFFSASPFYMAPSGIIIGYLAVHLLLAGGQLIGNSVGFTRTVWGGGAWSTVLAFLLACRFIVTFDMSAVVALNKVKDLVITVIPDQVFYMLIFSQPLLSLSTLYWVVMLTFVILLMCEGIPTVDLVGIRVIRSIQFALILGFSVVSAWELWEGGMLTMPLLVTMVVTVAGSFIAMLEAYLGITQSMAGKSTMGGQNPGRMPVSSLAQYRADLGWTGTKMASRLSRDYIPVPIQMQQGKKGV